MISEAMDYLATIPSHQKKGVATLLPKSGLVEADKAGLKTIVMTLPVAVTVYKRQGFEQVSKIVQDDSKFGGDGEHVNYFLARQPTL